MPSDVDHVQIFQVYMHTGINIPWFISVSLYLFRVLPCIYMRQYIFSILHQSGCTYIYTASISLVPKWPALCCCYSCIPCYVISGHNYPQWQERLTRIMRRDVLKPQLSVAKLKLILTFDSTAVYRYNIDKQSFPCRSRDYSENVYSIAQTACRGPTGTKSVMPSF